MLVVREPARCRNASSASMCGTAAERCVLHATSCATPTLLLPLVSEAIRFFNALSARCCRKPTAAHCLAYRGAIATQTHNLARYFAVPNSGLEAGAQSVM